MAWRMKLNGELRTESNTGFAAYVGRKRVAWSLDEAECVRLGIAAVKAGTTHRRFVPSVTIFDCAQILNVAFITDDATGITVHRRKAEMVLCDSNGNPI